MEENSARDEGLRQIKVLQAANEQEAVIYEQTKEMMQETVNAYKPMYDQERRSRLIFAGVVLVVFLVFSFFRRGMPLSTDGESFALRAFISLLNSAVSGFCLLYPLLVFGNYFRTRDAYDTLVDGKNKKFNEFANQYEAEHGFAAKMKTSKDEYQTLLDSAEYKDAAAIVPLKRRNNTDLATLEDALKYGKAQTLAEAILQLK